MKRFFSKYDSHHSLATEQTVYNETDKFLRLSKVNSHSLSAFHDKLFKKLNENPMRQSSLPTIAKMAQSTKHQTQRNDDAYDSYIPEEYKTLIAEKVKESARRENPRPR